MIEEFINEENYVYFKVICYSEKADVATFGCIGVRKEDFSIDNLLINRVLECMEEQFWELPDDFLDGVAKAKAMVQEEVANGGKDDDETFRRALYQVFGDFELSFTVDDEKVELDVDSSFIIDVNNEIYDMLECVMD